MKIREDGKLPSEAQRKKLCEMIYHALLEMRMLGWAGKSQQVADLADAFHNLPSVMWSEDFSLSLFRDVFLASYQKKYAEEKIPNYVAMVDAIIAMKD
jgi:hypothetical protein